MVCDQSDELVLALSYCQEVRGSLEQVLGEIKATPEEHLKLLMVAKVLRARNLFLGIVLLARERLVGPASALMRCLTELKFVALAVADNPDYVGDLVATDERERARALRNLSELPMEHRAATIDPEKLSTQLNEIGKVRKGPSVEEWARRAGAEDEYRLAYLLLSADVHPSLRGAESHLVLDDTGQPYGLMAYPDVSELPYRLMHAADCYLAIVGALPPGTLPAQAEQLLQRLDADERKRGINARTLQRVEQRPSQEPLKR